MEIHLAAGAVADARAASDELTTFAEVIDTPLLHAIADAAAGAVLLAEGDADGALVTLRRAGAAWRALGMPYDVARARVGIARACLALGDHEPAALELDAARATFERLGAAPDLERLAALGDAAHRARRATSPTGSWRCCGSSPPAARTGRSPRSSSISAHTVARHLQNIFVKLDLSSRAAATAYAYEHDLIG